MSAFYDQASLVVVPSGYKSGKIYAQKPLTTDGQLTFTRASTATRVNASGLIETVSSGVPRLDYQGSTCPKLLLEPQRTNMATYSEDLTNADWTKSNATVSSNTVTAPDGNTTADTVTDTSSTAAHVVYEIKATRSTGTAWSVFMKKGTLNYGFIGNVQSSTLFTTAVIDLTNGTVKELQNGSGNTGSVTVQNYGNGWYRVIMQSSANAGGVSFGPSDGAALSGLYKESIYAGTGSGTIYAWGAQLEDGAYTTSYIPTTSAAVTRLADFAKKENIDGTLPTAYPFTLYSESDFYLGTDDFGLSMIDIGTTNTYYTFGTYSNKYIGVARSSSGEIVATSTANYTPGLNKIAVVFTSSSIKVFANGALVATATNTISFSAGVNDIIVGTLREAADIGTRNSLKQALVFKSALTDAQCVELTTL
jgi:hypothetical protein